MNPRATEGELGALARRGSLRGQERGVHHVESMEAEGSEDSLWELRRLGALYYKPEVDGNRRHVRLPRRAVGLKR